MCSVVVSIFFAGLVGGMAAYCTGPIKPSNFQFLLLFIGSYLLSLTLLHLLPALFMSNPHASLPVGVGLLLGFFLQLLLGLFSKGVEHGHMYESTAEKDAKIVSATVLFFSLSIHSFFDGAMLSNVASHPGGSMDPHTHSHSHLLLGALLHKASETFAFVTLLRAMATPTYKMVGYLIALSMAAPLGIGVSWYVSNAWANIATMQLLTALAVGNILQVATTIFFEANPHHQLNLKNGLSIVSGIVLALFLTYGT